MPSNNLTRRQFNYGLASLAFGGLALNLRESKANVNNSTNSKVTNNINSPFGPLIPDPKKILDLPAKFSYSLISSYGKTMSDGLGVPDRADGMGCFERKDGKIVLIRNHEMPLPKSTLLKPSFSLNSKLSHAELTKILDKSYDQWLNEVPLQGGTSHVVYNPKTQELEQEFMSLIGTVRNCAGGTTPWGTWLSCEESVEKASSNINKNHGYVFEVPANATALIDAKPLTEMGRFNHEAASVDPSTGIVYLTEDRGDSLFYRFIPKVRGELSKGGRLQALCIQEKVRFDTRNWDSPTFTQDMNLACYWIDMTDVESPKDDLRMRGLKDGAALFARGEGIQYTDKGLFFCCTNGGNKQFGQIMRYLPSKFEGQAEEQSHPGKLNLFYESTDKASFNYGDNITIAPNGHLIVCEDQYTASVNNHLKGITPNGDSYDFAKVRWQTEPAGACFSPDGSTMFVNLYSPSATLAITGPWLA